MGILAAAACAALVSSAAPAVRAADSAKAADAAPSLLLDRPFMLQADVAPAGAPVDARQPLMRLINNKALEDTGITIGGRVEGSYTYGFNSPLGNAIAGRAFDFEHEDLTLNQVGIVIDRAIDGGKFDVGGRIEWIYGGDSRLIHSVGLFDHIGVGDGPDTQWDLNQAYVDVGFGAGIVVRAGKFNTPAGYEVIDPTGNDLYSHSILFGYAIPFTHTGVLFKQKVSEEFDYTLGVIRGWDTSTEDNNDVLSYMGGIHTKTADGRQELSLTVISGPDMPGDNDNWRTLVDLIYVRKIGNDLKLAFNADYAYEVNSAGSVSGSDAQWFGAAGYLVKQVDPHVAVVGRVEYFNDQDGARLTGGVGGTSLFEATLGLQITPLPDDPYGKFLVIRPEIRCDYSEKRFFDGGTDRYQVTAAIDAVYKF
jgi:hypothetical protein